MPELNFKYLVFISGLLLLLGIVSCQNKNGGKNKRLEEYSSFTFFSLDTVVDVKYKGYNKRVEQKIKNEFKRIYNKFSPSVRSSVLNSINRGGKRKIDRETLYLIKESLLFYKKSNGIFDITVKPLLDLWGFESDKRRVPSKKEIKKALKFVSSKRILLTNNEINLPEGFKIDLGGIAKGYAVDRAAHIFKKAGINNFLINAGGDLIAEGVNDKGKPWVIGIQHPRSSGIIKVFSVKNKAVATSGDYQRYFIKNGIRYCHIISPFTGYPYRKWASMTVIADDCITADALSTAFFGMDIDTIEKTINKYFKNIRFYGINSNLQVFTNFDKE